MDARGAGVVDLARGEDARGAGVIDLANQSRPGKKSTAVGGGKSIATR